MIWINNIDILSFKKFACIVKKISKNKRKYPNIKDKVLDAIYHLGPQMEDFIKMIIWDLRNNKIITQKQEDKIFSEVLKNDSVRKHIFHIIADAVIEWSNESDLLKKYDIYLDAYTKIKDFLLSKLEIVGLKTFPGSDIY